MSDAADRLAMTRQAILEQIARKQRRHDPREETAQGFAAAGEDDHYPDEDPRHQSGDWFGQLRHGVRTWWRYHPAHMALDLASPMMRSYARRKPVQLLAISLAAGAVLTYVRPWRLISITTLIVAVLKSSQLSSLVMAAMSAADYRKDHDRPA
jgi:Flp pilus assembly protein TadB